MSPMVKLPLTLEHALLGFVRTQPTHAYEIHQRLEQAEALGLVWHLKQSQLYALLARLEEAGYLASTTEPQGNRPPRKVLQLTPSGHAAFTRWMTTPVEHGRDFRQEFMAKLFFAQQDGSKTAAALLELQRNACQRWLAGLRGQLAVVDPSRTYETLVLRFRIGQLEAILTWLDACTVTLLEPAPR